MIFAHFGLIHALWGGFFGWWGVLGSLLPDVPGVIGWRRAIRFHSTRWWDYMPDWARSLYGFMHSVTGCVSVLLGSLWTNMILQEDTGPSFLLGAGYLLHILLDIPTHRGDPRRILREARPDVKWGVNWYQTPFYWTEIVALFLIAWLVRFGLSNVWFDWIRPAAQALEKAGVPV